MAPVFMYLAIAAAILTAIHLLQSSDSDHHNISRDSSSKDEPITTQDQYIRQLRWQELATSKVQGLRSIRIFEVENNTLTAKQIHDKKVIEADINRTFPNETNVNLNFADLKWVLEEFSIKYNQYTGGYFQGLNEIAALHLIVGFEPHETVWMMMTLFDTFNMKNYYSVYMANHTNNTVFYSIVKSIESELTSLLPQSNLTRFFERMPGAALFSSSLISLFLNQKLSHVTYIFWDTVWEMHQKIAEAAVAKYFSDVDNGFKGCNHLPALMVEYVIIEHVKRHATTLDEKWKPISKNPNTAVSHQISSLFEYFKALLSHIDASEMTSIMNSFKQQENIQAMCSRFSTSNSTTGTVNSLNRPMLDNVTQSDKLI